MVQHGGSIPFHILGGVKDKKTTRRKRGNKVTKRRVPKRKLRKKTTKKLSTHMYSPGTIIRKNGQLLTLTSSKQWTKI